MVERSGVEKSGVEMSCKGLYGEMLKQSFEANVTLDPYLFRDDTEMGLLILDNCDRSRQIEMMTLNDAEKRIEHCQEELNSKNG